ncbi:MAG: dihydroorotate dehydrogenase electron transfer subunit, partial [Clostridia bacterium]
MKEDLKCEIICKREIAPNQIEFILKNRRLAQEAKPGQFVQIAIENGVNILRRPISICDNFMENTRIIFEVKGDGTKWLAEREEGEFIKLMGPLGTGFTVEPNKKAFVIGGGIGTFPLYKLCKQLNKPEIFLGFRNKDMVVMENEFSAAGNLHIATDDGSYGYHGFAITLAEEKINECDIIYACGPRPMLKAVKALAEKYGKKAEISMEERMGCGIGACLVCVCKTTTGNRQVCIHD